MKSIGKQTKRKASESKIEVLLNDDKERSHKAAKRKGVTKALKANDEQFTLACFSFCLLTNALHDVSSGPSKSVESTTPIT